MFVWAACLQDEAAVEDAGGVEASLGLRDLVPGGAEVLAPAAPVEIHPAGQVAPAAVAEEQIADRVAGGAVAYGRSVRTPGDSGPELQLADDSKRNFVDRRPYKDAD